MTIEAKLLGCEMISNENVQHKDEEWFKDRDTILPYLKDRTKVFWSEIEKHAASHVNIPDARDEKNHVDLDFKIVVPFYNCEKWVNKCIESLKLQNYENFNSNR